MITTLALTSNVIFFFSGIQLLVLQKSIGRNLMGSDQDENIWGFGQVLSVLLLVLPVLVATETYYGNHSIPYVLT